MKKLLFMILFFVPINVLGQGFVPGKNPIVMTGIAEPGLSTANQARIYYNGTDVLLSKNGSAYAALGTSGGSGGGVDGGCSDNWTAEIFLGPTGATYGILPANTVLGQFKTGGSPSYVRTVMYATNVAGVAGTGTATLDLTTTSGTVVCSINFPCNMSNATDAGQQIGTGNCGNPDAGGYQLTPNTVYQARAVTQCGGTDAGTILYPKVTWPVINGCGAGPVGPQGPTGPAGGSGTVASGTLNRLAKYTATGTAVGNSNISDDGTTLSCTGMSLIESTGSMILGTGTSGSLTLNTLSGANAVFREDGMTKTSGSNVSWEVCDNIGAGICTVTIDADPVNHGTGTQNYLLKYTSFDGETEQSQISEDGDNITLELNTIVLGGITASNYTVSAGGTGPLAGKVMTSDDGGHLTLQAPTGGGGGGLADGGVYGRGDGGEMAVWVGSGHTNITGTRTPTVKELLVDTLGTAIDINMGGSSHLLICPNTASSLYNTISLNNTCVEANKVGVTGGGSGDGNLYVDAPSGGKVMFRNAANDVGSFGSGGLTVGASSNYIVDLTGRVFANVGASGAGNLAYSFVGDTDTGLYRSATDEMRFQTGGADRLTLSSTGATVERIAVQKNQNLGTYGIADNQNSGNVAYAEWRVTTNLGTFEMGQVGSGYSETGQEALNSSSYFLTDAAGGMSIASYDDTGNIRFYTAGLATANERMRVATGGNVGIGTTSPAQKLDVGGNIQASGNISAATLGIGTTSTPASDVKLRVVGDDGVGVAPVIDTFATSDYGGMQFRRARGTSASPTATSSGDVIAAWYFWGRGSSSYKRTTQITSIQNGAESTGIPGLFKVTMGTAAGLSDGLTLNDLLILTLPGYGTGIAHFNSSGVVSSSALNLAGGSSEVTGVLPVANGGAFYIRDWQVPVYLGPVSGANGVLPVNTVLHRFRVESASHIKHLSYADIVAASTGAGTAVVAVTNTSGTIQCSTTVNCNGTGTANPGPGTDDGGQRFNEIDCGNPDAGGVSLAAGQYDVRATTQCSNYDGGGGALISLSFAAEVTTP